MLGFQDQLNVNACRYEDLLNILALIFDSIEVGKKHVLD